VIAVIGAAFGVYIGFVNATPAFQIAAPPSRAPVEFGFYIVENSPLISVHIDKFTCNVISYIDALNNQVNNWSVENRLDIIVGDGNRQVLFQCSFHFGILITKIEVSVIVDYRWHFFGLDWWRWETVSQPFGWPLSKYDPMWREGPIGTPSLKK
jgi:hypothetical protein